MIWLAISTDGADFLRGLLRWEEKQRTSSQEAVKHTWLTRWRQRCASDDMVSGGEADLTGHDTVWETVSELNVTQCTLAQDRCITVRCCWISVCVSSWAGWVQWPRRPACRSPASVNWHRGGPGFDPRPTVSVCTSSAGLLEKWTECLQAFTVRTEMMRDLCEFLAGNVNRCLGSSKPKKVRGTLRASLSGTF